MLYHTLLPHPLHPLPPLPELKALLVSVGVLHIHASIFFNDNGDKNSIKVLLNFIWKTSPRKKIALIEASPSFTSFRPCSISITAAIQELYCRHTHHTHQEKGKWESRTSYYLIHIHTRKRTCRLEPAREVDKHRSSNTSGISCRKIRTH